MRGNDQQLHPGMLSYVSLEERSSATHPLRAVRKLVDGVLSEMSRDFVTPSRHSAIVGHWAESVMLTEKHNSSESSVTCDIHA